MAGLLQFWDWVPVPRAESSAVPKPRISPDRAQAPAAGRHFLASSTTFWNLLKLHPAAPPGTVSCVCGQGHVVRATSDALAQSTWEHRAPFPDGHEPWQQPQMLPKDTNACHVSFPMGHTTPLPGAWWGRDRGTQRPDGQMPGFWDRGQGRHHWEMGASATLVGEATGRSPSAQGVCGRKGGLRCPAASLKATSESKTKALGREAAGQPQPVGTRPEVTTAGG